MNNVCFLNVLSLNVRGIRDLNKRKSIFTWVRNLKADIIFFARDISVYQMFLIVGNFSSREICIFRTDQIKAKAFRC